MLAQRQNGHYVSAWKIARFYADLGDKEQAFHWLDIAYHLGSGVVATTVRLGQVISG